MVDSTVRPVTSFPPTRPSGISALADDHYRQLPTSLIAGRRPGAGRPRDAVRRPCGPRSARRPRMQRSRWA